MVKQMKDHRCIGSCEDSGTKSKRGKGSGGGLPALMSKEDGEQQKERETCCGVF